MAAATASSSLCESELDFCWLAVLSAFGAGAGLGSGFCGSGLGSGLSSTGAGSRYSRRISVVVFGVSSRTISTVSGISGSASTGSRGSICAGATDCCSTTSTCSCSSSFGASFYTR